MRCNCGHMDVLHVENQIMGASPTCSPCLECRCNTFTECGHPKVERQATFLPDIPFECVCTTCGGVVG